MSERIALGFCNNIDYEIVWDAQVFEDLANHFQICTEELSRPGPIKSERDLVVSILGFLQVGEGGERFVNDSALIERFASRFEKKITLGGTSVRAAIAMRKLGQTSALHLITQNEHVRRLIPTDSPYVCSNVGDSLHPHLIVQFGAGDRVRAGDIDIRARRPNRLIYHCNADRIAMKINPDFSDLIAGAQALLVSGFNAMQSEHLLAQRLKTVARLLKSLPDEATVFLEDGGYYDPTFRRQIYHALGRRLDVYSMNEDEMQIHLGRRVALRNVAEIQAALVALQRQIPAKTIVVHTGHWALAHGLGAGRYAAALEAGITMATTRFCYGDGFTQSDYEIIKQSAPSDEDLIFAEGINAVGGGRTICVPVPAVQQDSATTIGLGDAFVGGFLPALLS